MNALPTFSEFFTALWGHEPFPWQRMLADRVAKGRWPRLLDLPTASGKTACVDVAVYALAAQADREFHERSAPRRVWFVVDRRIVVDQAFERAVTLADKLAESRESAVRAVAERLRFVAGTERPLAVGRLRGGVLRDDGWARLPSQPAVITSTVDQLGSHLLFRGYGRSLLAAPIVAGLAANDSLVLLDEAHCSVPFSQTLGAVERFRGEAWAERPLGTPFVSVVLSATPPPGVPDEDVFPGLRREEALEHPVLRRRLRTSKPAEFVELKRGKAPADPLVDEAAARALDFLRRPFRRVGVVVNRVRTAAETAARLRERLAGTADVVLLTGRLRPYERDRLVESWSPYLRAQDPKDPERPVVLVSTQCIEVGADFSFDALVTECASLDALRQRFGRLARMGLDEGREAPAVVLVRQADLDEDVDDFIYGGAVRETWRLLAGLRGSESHLDFGSASLEARLDDVENLSACLAPTENAPALLPAHLDLLCQTAPPAEPEPDVSLYLHGRSAPAEVQVVWRCDLRADREDTWLETVALCPPVTGEMLSVELWRLRRWLGGGAARDEASDVEGAGTEADADEGVMRACAVWRGRDGSRIARRPGEIAPGDVVVVPAEYGIEGLGQTATTEALGDLRLDLWEPSRKQSGRAVALRLERNVLAPWTDCPPVRELLAVAEDPLHEREALRDAVDAVLAWEGDAGGASPPDWWTELLRTAHPGRVEIHPSGGVVLFAREHPESRRREEPDLFADDDDLLSAAGRNVSLVTHSESVERAAAKLAARCVPEPLRDAIALAARWHDAGKLDERFQVLLWSGDEVAAMSADEPLAKAASLPTSPSHRRAIREASGLPEGFRHEMLSMQLAALRGPSSDDVSEHALVLHLIASHHGHARPFAPVCRDPSPPAVSGTLRHGRVELDARERSALPSPHRVDSGVADRFWRLVRRFGWWGLAYLEAILRLSDWYGSAFVPGEDR